MVWFGQQRDGIHKKLKNKRANWQAMEEYVAVVTDEEGEQVEESRNETELLLDFGDAVSFHD